MQQFSGGAGTCTDPREGRKKRKKKKKRKLAPPAALEARISAPGCSQETPGQSPMARATSCTAGPSSPHPTSDTGWSGPPAVWFPDQVYTTARTHTPGLCLLCPSYPEGARPLKPYLPLGYSSAFPLREAPTFPCPPTNLTPAGPTLILFPCTKHLPILLLTEHLARPQNIAGAH